MPSSVLPMYGVYPNESRTHDYSLTGKKRIVYYLQNQVGDIGNLLLCGSH